MTSNRTNKYNSKKKKRRSSRQYCISWIDLSSCTWMLKLVSKWYITCKWYIPSSVPIVFQAERLVGISRDMSAEPAGMCRYSRKNPAQKSKPCTRWRHSVAKATKQSQNITEPPPCLQGRFSFVRMLNFVFCKYRDGMVYPSALRTFFHKYFSKCSGKLQSGFLMSIGGVLMNFFYHITPFLWVFDRWCKLQVECAGARN